MSARPSGTVTFMFTDIADSTQHWVAATLEGLAALLIKSGEAARGVQLFATAATIRTHLGALPANEQASHAALATACATLGKDAYQRAWVKGKKEQG